MLDMADDAPAQPLGYLLHRVAFALRTEVTTTVLDPLGLTFPQYICMRALATFPGRSNAELARMTNVSPQAMNVVLRSLQERGLATRPTVVASGRSLPAELTRDGHGMLRRTDAGVHAAEEHLLSRLTERQRRDFRAILDTLGAD